METSSGCRISELEYDEVAWSWPLSLLPEERVVFYGVACRKYGLEPAFFDSPVCDTNRTEVITKA